MLKRLFRRFRKHRYSIFLGKRWGGRHSGPFHINNGIIDIQWYRYECDRCAHENETTSPYGFGLKNIKGCPQ